MQYTVDEEKAVYAAKELVEKKYGSVVVFERKDLEILLSLLKKQQKENEMLKNENKRIKYASSNLFIDDYVPKKEIKEKIEELNRKIADNDKTIVECRKTIMENQPEKKCIIARARMDNLTYYGIIKYLKELLGE